MKAASTLCKAPALAKRIVANHRNAPRRALHTALPAMASSNGQGGGSSSNLPAHRYSSQLAPIFGGMGSWPLTSRFRALEEEMENMMRGFGFPSTLLSTLPTSDSIESALFASPSRALSLAVDVKDLGNAYEITADTPGMTNEDVKIELSPDNKILTIRGERKSETKEEEADTGFVRMERSYGSFARSFRLPDHADPDAIKAEMNQGVLKLTVPKKEKEENVGKEEVKTIPIDETSSA